MRLPAKLPTPQAALTTLKELGLLDHQQYQFIAVGGGRISKHLLQTAARQGLPVYQGYGLSETCSVARLNLPGVNRQGSVGKLLSHTQIRIGTEGEIEIKGTNFIGYLGEDASPPDWYARGDLGRFDGDGFLYITGRIKHMFVTSFGRNVNPEWVESALTQQTAIGQALIVGEGRPHNLALLWMRFPQTDDEVRGHVDQANQELPDYAQVHDFILMHDSPDKTIMARNGRLKRHKAIVRYRSLINYRYRNQLSKQEYIDVIS